MKKVLSIILTLLLIISMLPTESFRVCASTATSGTTGACTWTLEGTKLTISGNGKMANYSSPSNLPWGTDITQVLIEDGVTNIGNHAFHNCGSLTSAILPDSITSIGDYSFSKCTSLKSITIPNSMQSFGTCAFYWCHSLPGIIIPEGVTSIGDDAFSLCYKLKDISIPSSVTSIGTGVFNYCSSLTSLQVDENNPVYYSSDNCIIKKSTHVLVAGCNSSVIPNGVTSIGESAFSGSDFVNFTIPDSVTKIGGWAFGGCEFTSITIPKSLTNIAYGAFYLCDELTDVYYSGNRTDKKKINIGGGNEDLTDAKWHYAPCDNDAHTYDYVCATICKNCDYIRTASISHIYDSDCDDLCNICDERRTPKHIFVKTGENTAKCKTCNLSKTFDFIITTDETITLSYEASKTFDFAIENTSIAKIVNVSSSVVSMGSYYKQVSSAIVSPVYPGETTVSAVEANGAILTTSSLLVVEGEHQMQLSEVLKEVSCTEQGIELYTCKFCDYQEERMIDNPGHTYDNTCDTVCNVCNDARSITHTYDNACDIECNVCGYTRTVPPHNFNSNHICTECGKADYIPGDIDGVEGVTDADAEYMLMYTFFPADYPVNQECDFNGDNMVNDADAEHLLMFTFFPEEYPLN